MIVKWYVMKSMSMKACMTGLCFDEMYMYYDLWAFMLLLWFEFVYVVCSKPISWLWSLLYQLCHAFINEML